MSAIGTAWQMVEPSAPLQVKEFPLTSPGAGMVRIKIAGCGVCHTDLAFLYGGVKTRVPPPLTLGHEIAGTVEAVGPESRLESGSSLEPGQAVIVPAVLPCGECEFCGSGRENICLAQKMPGNDLDGGFASHIVVPARFLIPVPTLLGNHELAHLAVIADAVTTPYQAMLRGKVAEGDRVVIIGVGGIGIYGVQIAHLLGARVLAVDVDASRVEQALAHGASAAVCTADLDESAARKAIREAAKDTGFGRQEWKVFEMSGTPPGQRLAFSLLTHAGTLGIIGFTPEKVEVRLSNLMAFDADAFGSWGCAPRHYFAVLDLITQGSIKVRPFVTVRPLSDVNAVMEDLHRGRFKTRPILVPEQ